MWLLHEAGWENAKSVQSSHQGKGWLLWRITNIKYILTVVLFAYFSCSCHNMDLVFYQIGLSSVYHPYLVTTQLIVSNTLRRKEIPQVNVYQEIPVNWNAFHVTTSWSWLRQCQECAKLSSRKRVATLKNLKYEVYLDLFIFFLLSTWFHVCHFKVLITLIPSCPKGMMDCEFSLLIWAVLATISAWSFIK